MHAAVRTFTVVAAFSRHIAVWWPAKLCSGSGFRPVQTTTVLPYCRPDLTIGLTRRTPRTVVISIIKYGMPRNSRIQEMPLNNWT